jgi:hypothetical protein
MALIAKPLIKNKSWLVVNGDKKVGNVEVTSDGYIVKIGDYQVTCENQTAIQKIASIDFQIPQFNRNESIPYAVWPTDGNTYNDLFDVKRKIHIYTKTPESKCYYAAGYFKIKMDDGWIKTFCPKYIFLQRYSYHGPYHSEKQLDELSHSI